MSFFGANEMGSNDISAKGAVFFKPITGQNNVFKTGLYGFANG